MYPSTPFFCGTVVPRSDIVIQDFDLMKVANGIKKSINQSINQSTKGPAPKGYNPANERIKSRYKRKVGTKRNMDIIVHISPSHSRSQENADGNNNAWSYFFFFHFVATLDIRFTPPGTPATSIALAVKEPCGIYDDALYMVFIDDAVVAVNGGCQGCVTAGR